MAHGSRPGKTPLPHGNLQPEEGHAAVVPVAEGLLDEAEHAVLGDRNLDEEARRKAARAIESLTRRQRDLEKINDLALGGFEGPDYEMFAGELAAYAYTILASWMRRGLIYKHCADRGRPVGATETERAELAADLDQCEELAMETAAVSLTFFRDRVLLRRRWDVTAGATIATYFVGACLLQFPNVFRRWRRERQRWRDALAWEAIDQGASRGLGGDPGQDPQNVVVGTTTVMDELNRMPKELRNAVALVLDGHTYAEVAAMLGTTPRAIEGRLYRYRQAGSAAQPAPRQQKEHSAAS